MKKTFNPIHFISGDTFLLDGTITKEHPEIQLGLLHGEIRVNQDEGIVAMDLASYARFLRLEVLMKTVSQRWRRRQAKRLGFQDPLNYYGVPQ